MGGKHPAPGPVFIVSEFNGYALAKNDEHEVIMSKNKVACGDEGWRISNVPNDEHIQRMGYNLIIHNKHPLKLLGCDEDAKIRTSEQRSWDSVSGWRIIQQKDTNVYHFINHYDYWLTVNDDGDIAMLKKHQLPHTTHQNWHLHYISQQEMNRKVPNILKTAEETQKEVINDEHIIQNILDRNESTKMDTQQIDNEDGYCVDNDVSDSDHKTNHTPKKRKRKRSYAVNLDNIYNKEEMDRKFDILSDKLSMPLLELASSLRLIRSELSIMKIEMKNMEQSALMDRSKISEQLLKLQKMMKADENECVKRCSDDEYLSDNQKEVKEWMMNIVGLKEYYKTLINNGFDSLNIIKKISDPQQLDDIGITLKGHKIQIMAEILQLKYGQMT